MSTEELREPITLARRSELLTIALDAERSGAYEAMYVGVSELISLLEILDAYEAPERPADADNQLQPWPGPGYAHTAGGPGGHWEPVAPYGS